MRMDIDQEKVDQSVLALLSLGRHDGNRTWKSFDWQVMGRLHQSCYISDPVGKPSRYCSPRKACGNRNACSRTCSAGRARTKAGVDHYHTLCRNKCCANRIIQEHRIAICFRVPFAPA